MARRGNRPLDVAWVLLDTSQPDYATRREALRQKHEAAGSFKQSINIKRDGTCALIKVVGATPAWCRDFASHPAVLRIYTEADHHLVRAMVTAPDWAPPNDGL